MGRKLNPQLGVLIQTLYSVVMGISLSNLSVLKLNDFYFSAWNIEENSGNRFLLVLTLFTMLIAAHDWFTYHKKHAGESPKFSDYLGQILSITLIGLLFAFCKVEKLKEWYCVAAIYTSVNIVDLCTDKNNSKKLKMFFRKYLLHLTLVIIGLLPLFGCLLWFKNEYCYYTFSLGLSIILVLISWVWTDNLNLSQVQQLQQEVPLFSVAVKDFNALKGDINLNIPTGASVPSLNY